MIVRTLIIFFFFLFHGQAALAQIKCPDSLIYSIRIDQPFIKVYNPLKPISANNPSNTNIPIPTPGVLNARVLALMPNINGGTLSPTFYSVLINTNTFTYWDGTSWIDTGHSTGAPTGWGFGLGGCNGVLYYAYLPAGSNPTMATVYKYTGTGPAVSLFTVPIVYSSVKFNGDLITDCKCNLYTMLTGSLNKYDPNGNLLSSVPVTNANGGKNSLASVGHTMYTMEYAGGIRVADMLNSPITFTDTFVSYAPIAGPDNFASCPIDVSSPIVAAVNTATLGCNPPTASLVITSTTGPLSYTWTGPGLPVPANAPAINVNTPGVYTCVLNQGTCDYNPATLITTVVSNVTPVAPVITPSNNLCLAPNQQLFSSLSQTVYQNQWQGASITGGGSSATVNIGAPGIYTLTTTNVSNGCTGTATANILPAPIVSLSISSNTLCVFSSSGSNSITLNSTGASNYTLLASPGFTFNTQPSQPVAVYLAPPFPSGGAVGSAILIGSNGVCTGSAMAGFSVLPVTRISATPSATSVCLGKSQRLSASGAVTYTWQPSTGISSYDDSTVMALIDKPIIYSVTGTDQYGCNSSPESVSLSIRPLHKGILENSIKAYCAPFSGNFKFTPSIIADNNSYSTEWAVNSTNYNQTKFSYEFKEPGTYTINIKVTDSLYQCSNTLAFFVEAYPKPIADFSYSPSEPDEVNNNVLFSPASTNTSDTEFEWFFINNKNKRSIKQYPSYVFDQAGIYPVALVVKNSWNCTDTVVKAIEVKEDFSFYIPNAFTPNADEKNDVFLPLARSVKLYNMKIFDRWGNLVFETNDMATGWDGSYKGMPCKSDIYSWKINLSTNGGQMKTLTGSVSLMP